MSVQQMMLGGGSQHWIATWYDAPDVYSYVDVDCGWNAIDATGNIFSTGSQYYENGGAPYSALALIKQSPAGEFLWGRKLTGPSGFNWALPRSCVTDAAGNVYVSGYANNTGNTDGLGLLAKYDTDGTIQWQRQINYSTALEQVSDVYIDGSGDIYVTGWSGGNKVAYVMKLNSSGVIQWQKHAASIYALFGLEVDGSGNIYVAGSVPGDIGHIIKMDSAGNVIWQKTLTVSATAMAGIAVDGSGNVYASGQGPSYGGVVKLDSSGSLLWAKDVAYSAGTLYCARCYLGPDGNLYVTGCATGSALYAIILCFAPDGTLVYQRRASYSDYGWDISFSSGAMIVGAHSTPLSGAPRALIMKLPIDGARTGTYSVGGINIVYAASAFTITDWAPTINAGGLSFAASSHTESAGSMTDAAYTPTVAIKRL